MARIRTIKPEFFTSETIAALSREARLTFIGLWTQADDHGRAVDNPRILAGALWPLDDDVTPTDVSLHIHNLAELGLIERYEVDGRRYLLICGWDEHQRMNRKASPKHPAPPNSTGRTADALPTQCERAAIGDQEQGTGNRESSSSRAVHAHAVRAPDGETKTKTRHSSSNDRAATALRLLAVRLARQGSATNPDAFAAAVVRNGVQLPDLEHLADSHPDDDPQALVARWLAAERDGPQATRARCEICGATTHDASRCLLADPEEDQ